MDNILSTDDAGFLDSSIDAGHDLPSSDSHGAPLGTTYTSMPFAGGHLISHNGQTIAEIQPFAGGHMVSHNGRMIADIQPFAGGSIIHTHETGGRLGASMHSQHLGAGHSEIYGVGDHGGTYEAQHTPFTCAVVSQEMILHDFGITDVNEASLMGEAMQHGWLNANGTPMEEVGNLLELHGIQCHQGHGIDGMLQELAAGHKVIAAVDSDTLWHDSPMASMFKDVTQGDTPNHALVIQGVKSDGHGGWSVVVNDPGDPHGAGKEYPMDQFVAAWKDSHCNYTATNAAPPHLENHSLFGTGFDTEHGNYPGFLDWMSHHNHLVVLGGLAVAKMASATTMSSRSPENTEAKWTQNSTPQKDAAPTSGLASPDHRMTPPARSEDERNQLLRSI